MRFLFVILVSLALTSAHREPDLSDIKEEMEELRSKMETCHTDIKMIAMRDDAKVGRQVASKVDRSENKHVQILYDILDNLCARTVDFTMTRESFDYFIQTSIDVEEGVFDAMKDLTEETQHAISTRMYHCKKEQEEDIGNMLRKVAGNKD